MQTNEVFNYSMTKDVQEAAVGILLDCYKSKEFKTFTDKARNVVSSDDPIYIEFKESEIGKEVIGSFQLMVSYYKETNLMVMKKAHEHCINELALTAIPMWIDIMHEAKHTLKDGGKFKFIDLFKKRINKIVNDQAHLILKELEDNKDPK